MDYLALEGRRTGASTRRWQHARRSRVARFIAIELDATDRTCCVTNASRSKSKCLLLDACVSQTVPKVNRNRFRMLAARSARCRKRVASLYRPEACRAPGLPTSSSPPPRPRSPRCALHTSTRVQSTLVTHAARVRASPATHVLPHCNPRLHVKSKDGALASLAIC